MGMIKIVVHKVLQVLLVPMIRQHKVLQVSHRVLLQQQQAPIVPQAQLLLLTQVTQQYKVLHQLLLPQTVLQIQRIMLHKVLQVMHIKLQAPQIVLQVPHQVLQVHGVQLLQQVTQLPQVLQVQL